MKTTPLRVDNKNRFRCYCLKEMGEPYYALVWHLWRSSRPNYCHAGDQISITGTSCWSESEALFRDYATRQINVLLWFSLIAITALLLRKLISLFALWAKAKLIPGPPCPSFYGHSKLLSGANITDLLSKSHEDYGPVVKLWLGPTQLLVSIKDPELIREILLKAGDKLPLTGRAFHLAFGRSTLFVSSFDEVQKRRDLLAAELNGRFLERGNVIPTKVVDCVMERIEDIMAKGSVDYNFFSQHLAFTILGATLFGDAFTDWSKMTLYEELLMMIAKDACVWASYSVTPFWKQGFWRYQHLCLRMKSLTQDIIQQCRQNCCLFCQKYQNPHDETRDTGGGGAASFVPHSSNSRMPDSFFLWELDGHVNAREQCGNIMSVMFHGYLTTTSLIDNILAKLATNPEIQDKIHSEIITLRRGSQRRDERSVEEMLFLLATVYESARLLPAGPFLQRCSLNHDLNLKTGVTIPAGAILVVPVQLVQMDGSSWGSDACQFNPYRFLSKVEKKPELVHVISSADESVDLGQESFVLNDPNENAAFLPFGSGTRACLGQKFAILGVATLFASLLELYEIRLQPGSEYDPKPTMNKIVFVKRDC